MEARQSGADGAQAARVRARLDSKCVVLVGMMGSGKTSIGRRLAQALQLPFLDADAESIRDADRSIAIGIQCCGDAEGAVDQTVPGGAAPCQRSADACEEDSRNRSAR